MCILENKLFFQIGPKFEGHIAKRMIKFTGMDVSRALNKWPSNGSHATHYCQQFVRFGERIKGRVHVFQHLGNHYTRSYQSETLYGVKYLVIPGFGEHRNHGQRHQNLHEFVHFLIGQFMRIRNWSFPRRLPVSFSVRYVIYLYSRYD